MDSPSSNLYPANNDSPVREKLLSLRLALLRLHKTPCLDPVKIYAAGRVSGIPFDRPSDDRVNRFARLLAEQRLGVSVRKSRGRDIRAACGQLIVEGKKIAAGPRLAALMEG